MKSYRLVVRQQGRIGILNERAGRAGRYLRSAGDVWHWRLSVRVASVRFRTQMLESGPNGMKILMREKCRPVTSQL